MEGSGGQWRAARAGSGLTLETDRRIDGRRPVQVELEPSTYTHVPPCTSFSRQPYLTCVSGPYLPMLGTYKQV